MCDLIDLKSPDRKGLLSAKLASPLIPVPTGISSSNHSSLTNELNPLMIGKRDSLENNPFDMVLHKTTEYIQKKDDPFEVALEKALEPKCKSNAPLRTCSVDFTDDSTPKRKKHTEALRMNKTLDELSITEELNQCQRKVYSIESSVKDIFTDLHDSHVLSKCLNTKILNKSFTETDHNVPTIDIQNADLSILNQSIMNDTLFEISPGSDKDQMKPVVPQTCHQRNIVDTKHVLMPTEHLKVPKLRRSFSQGETVSPKKSQYLNHTSQSTMENVRTRLSGSSISSMSSLNSMDVLNDGFLKSQCSGSSVFSSLSNVSAITRLNSMSSTNSSMMVSNGTINRTFLESCSSDKTDNTRLTEKLDFNNDTMSHTDKTQFFKNDLIHKFNKLTTTSLEQNIPEDSVSEKTVLTLNSSNNIKKPVSIPEKDNKLIDIDVFSPQVNTSKENSSSDTSSDSVFNEGYKINKSILHEAKVLARTFEELALKSSSGSSIDDLITSNPSWTSELLPAFDDEAMVDNLIELPNSPAVNNDNTKNEKDSAHASETNECADYINNNKKVENIQDLETELIEPIPVDKRISAATLLLDLKKLISTESNMEANNLLENLEKVLGIQCKNNTELLTTYLNATNNLAKSPQKLNNSLDIVKNVDNIEESRENNLSTNSSKSMKDSVCSDSVNLNNSSTNKCVDNNEMYSKNINTEGKPAGSDINTNDNNSIENISKNKMEKVNNSDISETSQDCVGEADHNDLMNERMAVELLTNLGKLLNGQTEENTTLDLLRNLGKVLNFASNNCNTDNKTETGDTYPKIGQTPKKSRSKFNNKVHGSFLSKSANRLSLDLETKAMKPATSKLIRRSVSVTHSPTKNIPSPLMTKNASQLKEVKKRFPSDPGCINSTSIRKSISTHSDIAKVCNTEKGIPTKPISVPNVQKEKPIVISNMVKKKLKKKSDADLIIKKGPMRAVLPMGSMQRTETFGRKIVSSTASITPPKSHKIFSSTPNSINNGCAAKKSPRSKPVASSTPDAQNSKSSNTQLQLTKCTKKRNFSCDISPVTTNRLPAAINNGSKVSPKKVSKLSSPKRTTPKRRTADSSIPKSQTTPVIKRLNSSFDVNQFERFDGLRSPQRSLTRRSEPRKNSPIPIRKKSDNIQQSPLRDSNKVSPKVKPVNLISKLRRYSSNANIMEKENNYI